MILTVPRVAFRLGLNSDYASDRTNHNKYKTMDKLNTTEKAKNNTMLREVAVITPRFRDYLEFIRRQNIENEKYCFVDSIQKVKGRLFDRVEKLHNYFYIKDIDEVLDYLETHLRSNRT